MKNLFLTIIAISFMAACKKNDTQKDMPATDSVEVQRTYSDTATSTKQNPKDSLSSRDSINTKTHIGGRRTSNNNTGNGTGNINAAVSDSARPAK
ncbi:hypothetical protein HX13_07225 [Chryseobacterium sp. P1-3]|uniref:Lipoprotein n=1 Tax=Chryseobacterium gallinarum TaxID=1324352 RepID=A0A0G3M5Z5_CHRGL|nr:MULTISPECIES: hypothetical protein [Chryseobacterium]AKK74551.1 hypothetical protein OK18_19770 [Chryseobacterium gallinarum]KFF75810.1 hypothetical protein HX13_07225 [Chryseobacterium sp. P1-3]MCL8538378.1 hypothetical protein [Chryseobacterium gallinarum]